MSQEQNKPHYTGHRGRLRQEVLANLRATPEYKLLELLLTYVQPRIDTKPLAKELLRIFGNVRGVLDADTNELLAVKGMGQSSANFLALTREIWARYLETPLFTGEILSDNTAVAKMARIRLGGKKLEELWVALVDTRLKLVAWEKVSQGTINAAHFFPQEVVRMAIDKKAWGIILVHNHPGGSGPSIADIDLSKRLETNAEALGLKLLEHLIIIDNNYHGLRAEGFLPPLT